VYETEKKKNGPRNSTFCYPFYNEHLELSADKAIVSTSLSCLGTFGTTVQLLISGLYRLVYYLGK